MSVEIALLGEGNHSAYSESGGALIINWAAVEQIASGQCSDVPPRTVAIARILLAARDETWKPLLLANCPRNP